MPNFNGPNIKPSKMQFSSIKTKPFNKDGSINVRFPKSVTRTIYGFAKTKSVHSRGALIYGCVSKPYTRSHPYPAHPTHYPIRKREKVVILMLRKHGYSMNMIAKITMRSTSYIYRTLRTAILRLCLRPMDMRKLPDKTRTYTSGCRWRKLVNIWMAWLPFLLGEEDKPP
jgi:hypothetical protein